MVHSYLRFSESASVIRGAVNVDNSSFTAPRITDADLNVTDLLIKPTFVNLGRS